MLRVTTDHTIVVKRNIFEKDGKEYINYHTVIKAKNYDGKNVSCFIKLNFPKDIEIPDNTVINILDGFIAFNPYARNGSKYPYVYVKNYELVELGKQPEDDGTAFEDYDDYSFV